MTTDNSADIPTGAANTILQGQGVGTALAFSTATYPATTTINQLLYSSSANTIGGLSTGNSGVLITSAGGIPSISSTLPSAVQGNITSTGTIASGTWNGTVIGSTYGGTGVNNGASTITLGGNLTTSGAFATTLTATNTTTLTLPTSGTLATTSQIPATPISLANGGTNASLTANNGGIFYSTSTAGAILAGTSTASQLLLSGASTTPAWSTSTYPSTNAVSTLLYASSANVMAALATANSGVLITSSGGVPSISSTLPTAVQGNITSTGNLGNQLNTTRCVFFANLGTQDTNVTGDGTFYTFGSGNALTVTQQGTAMATNGTFTAPVTGWYNFSVNISLIGGTTATDALVSLGGSGVGGGLIPWRNLPKDTNNSSINTSFTIPITSGLTITIQISVSGLTKTVSIAGAGNGQATFSGFLIC